jgi:ATP-dependent protease HslVU (ClpYQ) peptidase subunit
MTTIAYRDGVMAADSRAYAGDSSLIGTKTKIHRLDDGTLFGSSSRTVGADAFLRRWVESGCAPPQSDGLKPDTFEVLLVRKDGSVFYAHDNLELTGPLTCDFFAIGSGDTYAKCAMLMGADAVRAVEIAGQLDVWTGGPTSVLHLDGEAE